MSAEKPATDQSQPTDLPPLKLMFDQTEIEVPGDTAANVLRTFLEQNKQKLAHNAVLLAEAKPEDHLKLEHEKRRLYALHRRWVLTLACSVGLDVLPPDQARTEVELFAAIREANKRPRTKLAPLDIDDILAQKGPFTVPSAAVKFGVFYTKAVEEDVQKGLRLVFTQVTRSASGQPLLTGEQPLLPSGPTEE